MLGTIQWCEMCMALLKSEDSNWVVLAPTHITLETCCKPKEADFSPTRAKGPWLTSLPTLHPLQRCWMRAPIFQRNTESFSPAFLGWSPDNVAGRRGSCRQLGSRVKEASLYRLHYLIFFYHGKLEAKRWKGEFELLFTMMDQIWSFQKSL